MTEVIIKKDQSFSVSGYSMKINGVELPFKKSVSIKKIDDRLSEVTVVFIATQTGNDKVIIEE